MREDPHASIKGELWDPEQTGRCGRLLRKAGRCVHRKSTCLWTGVGREASVDLGVGLKAYFPIGKLLGINKNWLSKMDLAMIWAFWQWVVWSLRPWVTVLPCLGKETSSPPVMPTPTGGQSSSWVQVYLPHPRESRVSTRGRVQLPFRLLFAFGSTSLKTCPQGPWASGDKSPCSGYMFIGGPPSS